MGARTAARKTRPTAPSTLFQLLGLGVIALGLGHGVTAVRAGEITATTGTLGLGTVVNAGVSCTSGACSVTGGTAAGSNLFHRFNVFDTSGGAITGVTFNPGGAKNIIVGVLSPTVINRPVSISGGSADLFWLSPGGLSIGNGGQFVGFSNLTLSTATDMLIGGGLTTATFNYQNTVASDILNVEAGFDGVPLNGLGSLGLTSSTANPGPLTIDGALLTVDQSLLLDSGDGSISLTGTSIEALAANSPPSITINADTIFLDEDANQNRSSIVASDITLQGRVIVTNKTDLVASKGGLNFTSLDSEPSQAVYIESSNLAAGGGSISIDAGDGNVSISGSSIEPLANGSPLFVTINADTLDLNADTNKNRTSIDASGITLQGRLITTKNSDLTASNGNLNLTAAASGQAQSALITGSKLSSNAGSISIDAGIDAYGSFRIQISNSELNATGGNITLLNSTSASNFASNTGILIDGKSSLTATAGAFEFPTGAITINGSGAFRLCSTSCFSRGIEINGNSSLSADTITLTGSGGDGFSGGAGNDSIPTVPASDTAGITIDSSVLNANSLSLTGNAGNFNTNLSRGIQISSSQLSGRQNLLLDGSGGYDVSGDSSGIRISSSTLSSGDSGTPGSLTLTGHGGYTNGTGPSRGILIASQSSLSSVGDSLTLTGTPGVNLNSGDPLPNDALSAILINGSTLSGTRLDGSSPTLQINSLGSDSPSGSALQDGFAIRNSQIDGFSLIDINSAGRLNISDSKLSTSADGRISLSSSFVPAPPIPSPPATPAALLLDSNTSAINLKGASLSVPTKGTDIAISADSINSEASAIDGSNTTITGPAVTIEGQKTAFSKTSIVATNGNLNISGTNTTSLDDILIGSIPSMEFADSSLSANKGSLVIDAFGPLSLANTKLTASSEITLFTQTAANSLGTSFSDASLLATGITSLSGSMDISVEGGPLSLLQSTLNTQAGPLSLQSAAFYAGGTTLAADAASVRIGNSTLAANGGPLTVQGSTHSLGSQEGAGIAITASSLSATGGNISLSNTADPSISVSASSTGVLIDGTSSLTATSVQVDSSPVGGGITINGSGGFRNCTTSCFSHGIEINGNSSLSADTITLTGSGGDGFSGGGGNDSIPAVPASDTAGITIDSSVLNANSLSLTGNAGNFNTNLARGIQISSSQLSGRQNLLLNGSGGYVASGDSSGIRIATSTLSSGDSGTPGSLSISGQGGYSTGTGASRGILIESQSSLSTVGGSLTLTGTPGFNLNSGDPLPHDTLSAVLINSSTLSGTPLDGTSPTLQINSLGSDSPSGSALQDGFALQNGQIDGFSLIDISSAGRLTIDDSKLFTSSGGNIRLISSFTPLTVAMATMASDAINTNASPGANPSPPPPATISLSNSTLSTYPENAPSGTGNGGTITIKADSIATYKTSLRTSGTSTGGEITIGADPAVDDGYLTDTVSIFNTTLFADPPTLGGIINIYGKNINILDSTLNLKGGTGGSLTAGGPSIQSSPSNTTFLLLNSNTYIYSSSNAPLQFNSSGTLINDAQINPVPPSPNPNPGPPLDNPTVAVLLKQTLSQDPLSTDPQTSTQIAKIGGPLLSDTTPRNTPGGTIAVNLVPSGDIPISPEMGWNTPEGGIPLDQRPVFSLSSDEARQSFDSGNAEAQEETAQKLGLTEDEQLTPPSAADLQKAMQAATRWIRSGATGDPPTPGNCGGGGQVPCAR